MGHGSERDRLPSKTLVLSLAHVQQVQVLREHPLELRQSNGVEAMRTHEELLGGTLGQGGGLLDGKGNHVAEGSAVGIRQLADSSVAVVAVPELEPMELVKDILLPLPLGLA